MKSLIKQILALSIAACAGLSNAEWPEKPIRLVVPYAPGGAADLFGRAVAAELSTRLKQQVIVENKAGAGGTIGAQTVVSAPADGYTFLYDASAFTVTPSLQPKLTFSYSKDFVPVGMVARIPTLLVVPAASPFNSVADVLKKAKAEPGKVNFASAGNGSAAHLGGELLAQGLGVNLTHVPYKGGGPALTDIAGGQVDMMFSTAPTSMPFIRAGKMKAIATGFDKRLASLPTMPTVAEQGIAGFSAFEWNGIWAAAATPADIVKRMETELREVLASAAFRTKLSEMGAIPAEGGAKELGDFVNSETAKWARVIKAANIKAD